VIVNKRDKGLVRAVGALSLAAGMIGMVVGAGIFTAPSELAASMGPYAPLAFLLCAVSIGCVLACFAEAGSRMPTSGGPYGYIEAVFGPVVGAVIGTMFWLGCVLANAAVAAALADLAVGTLPPQVAGPAHPLIIIAVVLGVAWVNVRGAAHGAKLVAATAALKLAPLLAFVVVGVFVMQRANFVPSVEPSAAGVGRALLIAAFAFMGSESVLCVSGEVDRPGRNIPRALAITVVSVSLLYLGIQLVAQGALGPALAHSKAPLADAMARVSPFMRAAILACGALSMFSMLASDILGSPRILFAFGQDGLLPGFLGRVHRRYHTPYIAILVYAVLAIGLALAGSFAELAVLSALTGTVLYIAGCLAAWVLARRGVALAGEPLNLRWLGPATVVGVAGMVLLIAMASREEIVGLLGAMAVTGVIYQLVVRWRARERVSAQ
jgi:basic amino acid/polyamine antiporter, APA family